MSRFFVGQRVKVVMIPPYCNKNPNKIRVGDVGVVVGTESNPNRGFHAYRPGETYLSVVLDRIGIPGMGPDYSFSPILPDGHRAAEESLEELLPFLKEKKVSA